MKSLHKGLRWSLTNFALEPVNRSKTCHQRSKFDRWFVESIMDRDNEIVRCRSSRFQQNTLHAKSLRNHTPG